MIGRIRGSSIAARERANFLTGSGFGYSAGRVNRLISLIAAAALAGSCDRPATPQAPDPATADQAAPAELAPPKIRLVVLVVIDQLASWTFERDLPYLEGGLARITRNGRFWPAARYPFASTYTAAGHAALSTGAPPSVTRILGNGWYRPELGRDRSAVDDPASPTLPVGAAPATALPGISPVQLAVDGVADVLREAHGGKARSISIGLKDRGAVYAAGKRPDLAVWYEPELAALTTSRFYASQPPAWLVALPPVRPRLTDEWKPLDAALLARITGVPDDAPGEGGEEGLDATFPHPLAGLAEPHEAMVLTPTGTDVMLEAAVAAVAAERLGADDVPDLLALTFSGHDYVGHAWGQESWERLDWLLRMDRSLAGFLEALDREVGRDAWALVLASDHGGSPMVEQRRAAGKPAYRLTYPQIVKVADGAAARALKRPGPWAVACAVNTVFGSPRLAALKPADRDRAIDAMVAALARVDGVAWAERTDRLAGDCEQRTGRERSACLSVVPGLSGEVFLQVAPDSILGGAGYPTGTTHGSGNPVDTDVPIAVLAPGLSPARSAENISPLRVAATLSKLLGIPSPPATREPPLF